MADWVGMSQSELIPVWANSSLQGCWKSPMTLRCTVWLQERRGEGCWCRQKHWWILGTGLTFTFFLLKTFCTHQLTKLSQLWGGIELREITMLSRVGVVKSLNKLQKLWRNDVQKGTDGTCIPLTFGLACPETTKKISKPMLGEERGWWRKPLILIASYGAAKAS